MNKQQNVMDRERKKKRVGVSTFQSNWNREKKLYNNFRMMIMAKLEINASRSHDIRLQYTIQHTTHRENKQYTKRAHKIPCDARFRSNARLKCAFWIFRAVCSSSSSRKKTALRKEIRTTLDSTTTLTDLHAFFSLSPKDANKQ